MTSAPKSASVLAAKGPAISWPNSRTFSPDKASGLSADFMGKTLGEILGVDLPHGLQIWQMRLQIVFNDR